MTFTTLINPADESVIRQVEHTTIAEVDDAISRAVDVQRGWSVLAPAARAEALRRFARLIGEHIDELARLEVLNSGHPISQARWEAGHVRDVLEYYSGAPSA